MIGEANPAPTLVFAYGNPSRGDDALGPLLLDRLLPLLAEHPEWGAVDVLTDFQLQIENALDLKGRQRVLFVDAAADGPEPFSLAAISPRMDATFTSHSLSPQTVLAVYHDLEAVPPPPTWLMGIRGYRFELGEDLSSQAAHNLEAGLQAVADWLAGKLAT